MPQLGTDEKPFVMSTGTIASKEIKEYNSELEGCRAKSKTFSMDQE